MWATRLRCPSEAAYPQLSLRPRFCPRRRAPRPSASGCSWLGDVGSSLSGLPFLGSAQALAGEFDAVSIVDEMVEDGVGVGGISDDLVPAVYGELRGDHRR